MLRCEDEGGTSVDQRIINLYDRFTHGGMSRREFLDRLAELAGSAAAAAALLPLLQNNYALAAIVAADDGRLAAERVSYDSPKGKINGYLVRPKAKGKRPAVIVIHETAGSTRISKMWRAGSRSRATSRSRPTSCPSTAVRRRTRTRRASFTPRPSART